MTILRELLDQRRAFAARGLKLNMTRGVPCKEQLELCRQMLHITDTSSRGIDCRNYGQLEGLPEAREFFATYLNSVPEETIVGGNSSLSLMHDVIAHARLAGMPGDEDGMWRGQCVFLCPGPGYDRHLTICESLGINMLPVRMTADGPDLNEVQSFVKNMSVVGMWCTYPYHNPTGITYSDEVVRALLSMKTANGGFRIFLDKAYAVHDLTEKRAKLLDVRAESLKSGTEDRVFQFCSTSKITWAGAGVCAMSASPTNIVWFKRWLFAQTIGPDKLNQLRHVRFLENMGGVYDLMAEHRKILKPKFDTVDKVLRTCIGQTDIASWTTPEGGYFISLEVEQRCAKRVVELASGVGVELTKAGATHPYGRDFDDKYVRLAPTCPSLVELGDASEVIANSVHIASIEKRENRRVVP
ncbi:MAG: aminotransferase class I/II-fold pyridoxal phosphate-dependent enzyme [Parcubacteria group bacterium]|nr:aminotransferase class I/II-fold pyridoxal phosphate-dependent enzyme [Parcubacteria group bacterium]